MTGACVETTTLLDCAAAFAVLEPYFLATREVFVATDNRAKRVRMLCATDAHDAPRHFAGCSEDGRLIVVAPQMVELPEKTVAGIFAHELGHALDFARPAEYVVVADELRRVPWPQGTEKPDNQERVARMRQWRDRDHDTVERTADAIAEWVMGVKIGYSGPCLLQSLGEGRSRPIGLR